MEIHSNRFSDLCNRYTIAGLSLMLKSKEVYGNFVTKNQQEHSKVVCRETQNIL